MAISSTRTPGETRTVRVARDVHLNVLLLASKSLDALESICQEGGITHSQYVALWTLCLSDDPHAGIPVSAVSDGLLNRASDTTRLLDRLQKQGLVERLPNPRDRRGVLVRPTEAGLACFASLTPKIQEFHSQQWAHLSREELNEFRTLLGRALWGGEAA